MEHPTQWLQAYYDNQLNERSARQVAKHLESCQQCQNELAALKSLSILLQESFPADNLLSSEIFVAQIGMRLPRKQNNSAIRNSLETGWRLAPFGVLTAWAFIQAVFIVSTVIMVGLQVIPGAEQIVELLPMDGSSPSVMTTFEGMNATSMRSFSRELIGNGGPLGWSFLLNVAFTLLIGLLYISWLASWWIRNTNGNEIQTNGKIA